MKKFSKLIGFVVVFMVMIVTICTVSFAAETDVQYTENLIPKMSSNTSPSGVSISSSDLKDFFAWKAFDYIRDNYGWVSQQGVTSGWLEYDFPDLKCISKYTLSPSHQMVGDSPKDWTFEGWSEQANKWIVLDTRKNITDWQKGVKKEFTFTNKNSYKKYRINITSNGGYFNYVDISEMEMMASVTLQASNQLKLVLEVNEDKQLSVIEELSDNTEMDWKSFDSSIATVDENGKVKALKSGNTVITCTSKDKSYTESINVLVVDLEYQLAVDLTVGAKCRLTVDDFANATNVTWSSYDSTIATVSAKGKVTAVGEGLTYIVASDKDGKEIGRIYIRVRK